MLTKAMSLPENHAKKPLTPNESSSDLINIQSSGFKYGVKYFNSPKSGWLLDILIEVLTPKNPEHSTENISLDFSFLIQLGGVYVNHKRCQDLHFSVTIHDLIRVHTQPRRYNVNYSWTQLIQYECEDFLVLNKPSGLPSHPSVDNAIENSLTQLSLATHQPLFVTHRLDTLTSGLIIYGKKTEFVHSFNTQLQKKQITKKYVALLHPLTYSNQLEDVYLSKSIIHYMEKSPRAPKQVSQNYQENWDICELKIESQIGSSTSSTTLQSPQLKSLLTIQNELIKTNAIQTNLIWIKINLLTGRTHQIRAQMANIGYPVLNDPVYGQPIPLLGDQLGLKAQEIEFQWANKIFKFQLDENFDHLLKKSSTC